MAGATRSLSVHRPGQGSRPRRRSHPDARAHAPGTSGSTGCPRPLARARASYRRGAHLGLLPDRSSTSHPAPGRLAKGRLLAATATVAIANGRAGAGGLGRRGPTAAAHSGRRRSAPRLGRGRRFAAEALPGRFLISAPVPTAPLSQRSDRLGAKVLLVGGVRLCALAEALLRECAPQLAHLSRE